MTGEKVEKSMAEWMELLKPEQFRVCRLKGTEPPFSGPYDKCTDDGAYLCICCGNPLFSSDAKFDSGTGWPSFTQPIEPHAVETEDDHTLGMPRTEVTCAVCNSHLGHVFEDGPAPTGLRYCMNSISLALKRDK